MRIALAQINPTVGDIVANTAKHLDFISRAQKQGATLVVFPELSLLGYPPKDLLLKSSFITENLKALEDIARQVRGIDVIIGYADRNPAPIGRPLYNAVALLRDGQIHSRHFKTLLPTYDVFDESRYFEPGPINETENLVRIGDPANGSAIAGLSICEDLWNDEKLIARRLYHKNPIADLNAAGAEILINASASPFVVGKHDFRLQLFGEQVKRFNKPLIYVNQVGGNDELVFDGNSHVLDARGNVIAQAKDFEEDLLVVDLEGFAADRDFAAKLAREEAIINAIKEHNKSRQFSSSSPIPDPRSSSLIHPHATGLESIYKALVLGLKDYVRKCGFKTAVLGLSGGIDSALTAAIAAHALGAENITGVAMPSRYSSDHSIKDARVLAKNLGMHFSLIEIDPMHAAFEKSLTSTFEQIAKLAATRVEIERAIAATLRKQFNSEDPNEFKVTFELGTGDINVSRGGEIVPLSSLGREAAQMAKRVMIQLIRQQPAGSSIDQAAADLTDQNLQARIRGATLMAFSNRFNHLLLTTGNKSEIAVGYCTLYGDMCGGLAVISDVPKTTVWALSRWINEHFKKEIIPWRSIEKVPSAELKPNQTDQDSLPPYDVLDDILHRYVEEEKGAGEIIAEGFDAAIVNRVIKLIDRSEYKRRQAAPGLKVTSRAFGFGRRMPIAQNYVPKLP